MTIERLRSVLSAAGLPVSTRELTEILWLACHLTAEQTPTDGLPDGHRVDDQPLEHRVTPENHEAAARSLAEASAIGAGETAGGMDAPGLYAEAALDGRGLDAHAVQVPTAPMLHDTLAVQRALRPLKRKVPSNRAEVVDEAATAERIAEQRPGRRRWIPVMRPSPERWLSLAFVVDTGPSMWIWQALARELQEALTRLGAFRDLRTWYLRGGDIATAPGGLPLNAAALLDSPGRQACLVLSDCCGTHWWNGLAPQVVRLWGQSGPTAILQPLAERLWRRTAAPPLPGLAHVRRSAAPNVELQFTPYDTTREHGIPVPVMEISPRWLADWARLVAGPSCPPLPMAAAYISGKPMTARTEPLRQERDLPIAERVQRFQAAASPEAVRLAAHVAVSVPTLPVMRLIHHRLSPNPQPGHIAEVLLSGLLRSVENEPGRYQFIPGARQALLATQPRSESWYTADALARVSSEIENRLHRGGETFRAYLQVPAGAGDRALAADQPFALVSPEALSYLRRDATVPASRTDQLTVPPGGDAHDGARSKGAAAQASQMLEEGAEDATAPEGTRGESRAASERSAYRTGAKTADSMPILIPEATAEHPDLLAPRSALIISASRYMDSRLPDLPTARNLEELTAILGDPQTGGFRVIVLRDPPLQTLRHELEQFLFSCGPGETALVYLSGHGLLSSEGRPIFAASDTELDSMAATGLDLRILTDLLNQCLAQRQIVILDGAHSRKLADMTMGWLSRVAGEHHSRVVITASRAEQSALEEEGFTPALVDGLRTGAADQDGDGLVSVSEAYAYATERLRESGHRQAPQIVRSGGAIDTTILTRSPARLGSAPPVAASPWERLDRLPGLDGVQRQLRQLITQPEAEAQPGGGSSFRSARPSTRHLVFVGGPGTGKTTVAWLIGEIYRDLGVLRRGHVVTASRFNMGAGYVGQTAVRTNALVDRALDGVLFIDEAHALRDDHLGFYPEAIDTLLRRIDSDGDRIVVIMSGDAEPMREFLDANPGLRERFPDNCIVKFEDYGPEALQTILLDRLRSAGMRWTAALESLLREVTAGMYRTRTPGFGNAREMVKLAQEIQVQWARRVSADPGQPADTNDLPERMQVYLDAGIVGRKAEGHVFISYTHEDSAQADQLQHILQAAGIPVWRDTAELRPGDNWRATIRNAITSDKLVFLACFSSRSLARQPSYQNEELLLAIEQVRLRSSERPWLIPVRFDDCEIPGLDLGRGRTLTAINRADLFGDRYEKEAQRLVAAVLQILGQRTDSARSATAPSASATATGSVSAQQAADRPQKVPPAPVEADGLDSQGRPRIEQVQERLRETLELGTPDHPYQEPVTHKPVERLTVQTEFHDENALKIALWGAPGSGKTTYLAALSLATADGSARNGSWIIVPRDERSSDLREKFEKSLVEDREFPEATFPYAPVPLEWLFVGNLAASRFDWRRLRRGALESRFILDLIDVPGAAYRRDPDQATVENEAASAALDHLAEAQGIIFLFDPIRERDDRDAAAYLRGTVNELLARAAKNGPWPPGRYLPHHVSVCITKFDHPEVFDQARQRNLVISDHDGMPRVHDKDAERFFDELCTARFWGERYERGQESAQFVRDQLRNVFHPDRIRYFVTSSIGFWVEPRTEAKASALFNPTDFANYHERDGIPRIRGKVRPINVLEPLISLQQRIARAG